MTRPAVFLDRDGTIIEDVNYIAKPDQVRLVPGVARALRKLNDARIAVVVITNQSGIARGLLTEDNYDRVHARMAELLRADGARLNAAYMCPHHPDFTGPCECRKPGTLLFRRAAKDLGLDLARSWLIGDKLRDVSPAKPLGARGILVTSAESSESDIQAAQREFAVAKSLDEAVNQILKSAG